MKVKKLLSVVLAAVLSASVLVGCGNKGGGSSSGKAKDTIVYSMNTAPEGIFNPLISNISIDNYVNSVVYASLMTVNEKGEKVPYLATKEEISDDMKKITYTINDKAVWHDGEKVTANDVAYTFKCMADPNYTGGYYNAVQYIKGAEAFHNGEAKDIEGIKVKDDKTIEIDFEQVYAPAVTSIGGVSIIPEHIWSKVNPAEWTKQTELLNKPVGCGPYKLTEYKAGSHVKFEAAKDFFEGDVKTPKLVFKVINADTTQAEFKNGDIDIANVESLRKADIDALKSEGLKTVSYDNYMFTYMGFNLRKDSLKDAKVRQAIMFAIDRQSILDNIVEGRGSVVNAPLLPSSWAYPEESELEQYKFDTEKAKSLLKEAGWEDKDGDGIVENSKGEKLELTIDCQNDNEVRQKTATAIQESLKSIGIGVEINTMEYSALMDKVVANHDFDMYMMGNTLSLDPDPEPMWDSTAISNKPGEIGYNIVAYNNPETDKLIDEGNATLDQNKRKSIYGEFAKTLNKDVPEAYLFCQDIERAYVPNLEGYKPSTFNEFYNVHNWVIK